MSKPHNPSPPNSDSDSESSSSEEESSSSEEDSSREEDEVPRVQDRIQNRSVSRKERPEPLTLPDAVEAHKDFPLGGDLVRARPATQMVLTTAQRRTRWNMLAFHNTKITQTPIANPVLYVAIYSTGEATSEVDDYHWLFIVGPENEEADSKGTVFNMEPRAVPDFDSQSENIYEWRWLYNQPTIPLRGQHDLLARLMIAEVANMEMLQAIFLRWAESISMRAHPEWMSVKWVKKVLESLDEERGCLGSRMASFESVETEGRWLAETEEGKRKKFSLMDASVSTRSCFQRKSATALSSTATVDIAVKYPVLYVGVYMNYRSPHEEFHWALLIGPANEIDGSEGVYCGIDFARDSDGRRTWCYNQTVVPLRRQPRLLVRMLIAEVVDVRPLGEMLRDHDSTPTAERRGSIGEALEWNSLAWVRGKLEMLERKPECFAYKCFDFGIFESRGKSVARGVVHKRKEKGGHFLAHFTTICLVPGWKKPNDDEVKVLVKLDPKSGNPNTISMDVQIVTGTLGVDALELRRQVAETEMREIEGKRKEEERTGPSRSGDAFTLAEYTKPPGMDEIRRIAGKRRVELLMARRKEVWREELMRASEEKSFAMKDDKKSENRPEDGEDENVATKSRWNAGEHEATARPQIARVITAVNLLDANKLNRATEERLCAKEDEENGDQSEDNEVEDEDEEDEGEEEDEEDEADDDKYEESDGEDGEDGEDEESGGEDDEDDEGNEDDKERGEVKGKIAEEKANGRPESVRKTAIRFEVPNKPNNEKAIGEKNLAEEKDKEEDETDSEEEEEEDEEEEEEEEDDEDDSNEDDNEEDDGDSSEDDDSDEDEDDEDGAEDGDEDTRPQAMKKDIPRTLSR